MIAAITLLALAQLAPVPATRTIHQRGADWAIDLTFRATGPDPVTVAPSDLSLTIAAAGLSNPRPGIPGRPAAHSAARPVAHSIDGGSRSSVVALVDNGIDDERCLEKVNVILWPDDPAAVAAAFGRRYPEVGPRQPAPKLADPPGEEATPQPVTVEPGGLLNVRIVLRHEHAANDGVDPLLGRRELTLKVGPWAYRDTLDLASEQYLHLPERHWRPMDAVPVERRDDGLFVSPPYSLVLDADAAGFQYFRFPERRVRGGVRIRLSFRYYVAVDCEGEPKFRVAQYREAPDAWKVLSDGGFDRELVKPVGGRPGRKGEPGERAAGKWREYAEVFTTQPETTTLAIDFRLAGAETGLVWIDDFALDYVGVGGDGTDAP